MTDTASTASQEALDAYAEALVRAADTITVIFDHMAAYAAAAPPADEPPEPFDEVLMRVVKDVMRPESRRRPAADLARAAQLLEITAKALSREVYLVPPGGLDGEEWDEGQC